MSLLELSAREIYDTYAQGADPADLIAEGRESIATRLRVEEGLDQREAYYAADQLLAHAQELARTGGS